MEVKAVIQGDQAHVSIAGHVDEVGAQRLEDHFNRLDLKAIKQVIIDFKEVAYIGSAGIGILLLLYKKVALHNGRVIIEKIPRELYTLLADDMNLGRVFTLSSI